VTGLQTTTLPISGIQAFCQAAAATSSLGASAFPSNTVTANFLGSNHNSFTKNS
jgi:hypothetical protein